MMTNRLATSAMIDIACPGCGQRFIKPLAWLQTINAVACPGCGNSISIRRYKAQAAASRMFEKLTGMSGGTKGS